MYLLDICLIQINSGKFSTIFFFLILSSVTRHV